MCLPAAGHWNRRTFLKASAILSASSFAPGLSLRAASPSLSPIQPSLMPFPMTAVRLSAGIFQSSAEVNQHYLETLSTDRLLHSFRLTAGLSSTAEPYGGWELPTSELRGHFAGGHYLSAAAFAYVSSGNEVLRSRADALVAGLAACQKANGNGYVSAFPTSFFDRLSRGEKVWAPFYTLHKIFAGLLDMYQQTGNEDALHVAEGIAAWTSGYFAKVGEDQRLLILKNEFGGMNESLVNLAQITGQERYLATAKLFEQPWLLDSLANGKDNLTGLHANTTVPKIIGAARAYEVTGERRYRDLAEYFLDDVLRNRTYAIGNTSDSEHWRYPAGDMKCTLSLKNAECCVAYNLMKLDRLVFRWTADAHWMDEYERTLLNARLGTQNPQGLKQYFFPLAAGYWRAFNSHDESFWCCTGTGAEDFAKFNDTIFFHSAEDLYVNQFVASELLWKEKSFGLRQNTGFPMQQATQLIVQTDKPQERTVFVRIPRWLGPSAAVKINGRPFQADLRPGTYLPLRRSWNNGDKIELTLPMQLSEEILPGDPSSVAVSFGPLVLAANLGDGPKDGPTKFIHGRPTVPKVDAKPSPLPPRTAISLQSAENLRFSAANKSLNILPIFQIQDQKYSVYWHKDPA